MGLLSKIGKGIKKAVKSVGKAIGSVAQVVAPVASLIPGVGTAIGAVAGIVGGVLGPKPKETALAPPSLVPSPVMAAAAPRPAPALFSPFVLAIAGAILMLKK